MKRYLSVPKQYHIPLPVFRKGGSGMDLPLTLQVPKITERIMRADSQSQSCSHFEFEIGSCTFSSQVLCANKINNYKPPVLLNKGVLPNHDTLPQPFHGSEINYINGAYLFTPCSQVTIHRPFEAHSLYLHDPWNIPGA